MCGWGGVFPEKYFGVKKALFVARKKLVFCIFPPLANEKFRYFLTVWKTYPFHIHNTIFCCFLSCAALTGKGKENFCCWISRKFTFIVLIFLTYTHIHAYLLYGFCLACCMFVYCMKNLWGVKILWDEKNFLIKFLLKTSSDEFCIVENLAFVKNKIKRFFRKLINGRWIYFGIFN